MLGLKPNRLLSCPQKATTTPPQLPEAPTTHAISASSFANLLFIALSTSLLFPIWPPLNTSVSRCQNCSLFYHQLSDIQSLLRNNFAFRHPRINILYSAQTDCYVFLAKTALLPTLLIRFNRLKAKGKAKVAFVKPSPFSQLRLDFSIPFFFCLLRK